MLLRALQEKGNRVVPSPGGNSDDSLSEISVHKPNHGALREMGWCAMDGRRRPALSSGAERDAEIASEKMARSSQQK
jgi:hypothetical protein